MLIESEVFRKGWRQVNKNKTGIQPQKTQRTQTAGLL
jgi:hypothetical protein